MGLRECGARDGFRGSPRKSRESRARELPVPPAASHVPPGERPVTEPSEMADTGVGSQAGADGLGTRPCRNGLGSLWGRIWLLVDTTAKHSNDMAK